MQKSSKLKRVAVIGLGYVGLPLALLADSKGYDVIGIDLNLNKIKALSEKSLPPPLTEDRKLAAALKKSSLNVTSDFNVLKSRDIIVVCVPTPVHKNHLPDLVPVEKACESIARNLQKGQLIVLESTVNPGVCDEIVIPMLEKISGLKAGKDFFLAHCPERINPGDPKWTVKNIPRVVGGFDDGSLQRAAAFYRSIIEATIKEMGSLKEAEAVKIVENSFRDVNIAFVNELAMSFSKLDIDVVNVINGAATKPFAFMAHYPGAGVGGHCIPVDPYYLIDYAKKNGFAHKFLSLAREINEGMPQFTIELLEKALKKDGKKLKKAKIAVLGISYKPNVGDSRESPSFEIIELLEKKGAHVRTYDPYVPDKSNAKNFHEATLGADAVIVATAHKEFTQLAPRDFINRGVRIVIDGRNCLDEAGFEISDINYRGIGR